MTKRRRIDWKVRAYGNQRHDIELDLLTQIVIMLARQLEKETLTEGSEYDTNDVERVPTGHQHDNKREEAP